MPPTNEARLEIVFTNPEPKRDSNYQSDWLLQGETEATKIFVIRDASRRPRIIWKEAA